MTRSCTVGLVSGSGVLVTPRARASIKHGECRANHLIQQAPIRQDSVTVRKI